MQLSIITINLNNKAGLEKTIKSVVSQTWRNFEFIIIDGGSTDGSIDVIKNFNDHITYWISEKDKGIYNAMNKGLSIAKGRYVQFLNSGDYLYEPGTLLSLAPYFDGIDIIYGDAVVIENNKEVIRRHQSKLTYLGLMERTNHLCHQAVFMSRKSIDMVAGGFDENYRILSDWKLLCEALIKHNATYRHLTLAVVFFDLTGLSFDKNSQKLLREEHEKILIEDYPLFYNDYKKVSTYKIPITHILYSKYSKLFFSIISFFKK